jgi:hypothetical protein
MENVHGFNNLEISEADLNNFAIKLVKGRQLIGQNSLETNEKRKRRLKK